MVWLPSLVTYQTPSVYKTNRTNLVVVPSGMAHTTVGVLNSNLSGFNLMDSRGSGVLAVPLKSTKSHGFVLSSCVYFKVNLGMYTSFFYFIFSRSMSKSYLQKQIIVKLHDMTSFLKLCCCWRRQLWKFNAHTFISGVSPDKSEWLGESPSLSVFKFPLLLFFYFLSSLFKFSYIEFCIWMRYSNH